MREVVPEVRQWQSNGERVALATVVSVVGSAPRGLGATLAISERGGISGSVSGGCVEPAVIEEGLQAIRTGKPRLLKFGITAEQNVEQIGLSCGGEIRVFVERFEPSAVTEALLHALESEEPAVLATVISAPAGRPGLLGEQLLMVSAPAGGETFLGALRESPLEKHITKHSSELLRRGVGEAQEYPWPHSLAREDYETHETDAVEVFYDVYPVPLLLIIVGAGHISIPLTRLAKVLGYRVIVVDAREAFATQERFPEADELLVEWPDEALGRLTITASTAVAVLTHDDKFDVPALGAALRSPAGYVGAIGSRSTREQRDVRLRVAGVTAEQIARIHGPIGLPIGAKTPEEIALAILTQIVAIRHNAPVTG